MGRGRRQRALEDADGDDSSDDAVEDDDGGEDGFGGDPDLVEEARLFRDPTRKRRRFTKEESLYGIFGEDSDDDSRRSRRDSGKPMAGGIKFVKSKKTAIQVDRDDENDEDINVGAVEVEDAKVSEGREEKVDEEEEDYGVGRLKNRQQSQQRNRRQEQEHADQEDDEEESSNTGLGFGGSGLGFESNNRPGLGSFNNRPSLGSSNARDGLGSSLPTAFGKVPSISAYSSSAKQDSSTSIPIPESTFSTGKPEKVDKDFAKFEKMNKGIGLKYMLKMGYKVGAGLGKGGSGIVEPIDVKLRPQKMGLGHKGFDETTKAQKKLREKVKSQYVLSDDEDEVEGREKVSERGDINKKKVKHDAAADGWKKGKRGKKVVYRTANDVVKEQEDRADVSVAGAPQKVKIIDMTGRETRELTDMSEASSASHIAALKATASHLMELRYNVRMLVSESETELVRLTKALSLEKQNAQRAAEDESVMQKRLSLQRQKRERLSAALDLAKRISADSSKLYSTTSAPSVSSLKKPPLTIAMVDSAFSEHFETIQDSLIAEFKEYGLDLLVIASVGPLIKRLLVGWDPLRDPKFCIELFQKWRLVLRQGAKAGAPASIKKYSSQKEQVRSMSAFENMMYDIWLPRVRQAINNNWSPRSPDMVVNLLEAWYPSRPPPELSIVDDFPEHIDPLSPHILPPWLHHNIIVQLLLPKLKSEIEACDFRRDPTPPHSWLFPWLPVLGDYFESLHEPLRLGMSTGLSDWHPREHEKALSLLRPWSEALPESDYSSLLNKTILPKLVAVLRNEFQVNPAAQDNEPLVWILAWRGVFPDSTLCHLLETEFFPKWIRVLWSWLSSPRGASFEEVTRWYAAWKTFLPVEVVKWQGVADAFRVGLDLMKRASSLRPGENLGTSPPVIIPFADRVKITDGSVKRTGEGVKDSRAGLPDLMWKKSVAIGFQDLLERAAADNGVAVLPTTRTHGSGKPIFKLVPESSSIEAVGLQFYAEEGVLFVYEGGAVGDLDGKWSPMGIDEAMSNAKKLGIRSKR